MKLEASEYSSVLQLNFTIDVGLGEHDQNLKTSLDITDVTVFFY
jgi:hypothetical protein